MIRISYHAGGMRDLPLEQVVQILGDVGYDAIEMMCGPEAHVRSGEVTDARLRDVKRAHEMCDGSLKQTGQSAYRWMVRGELMLAGKQATDQYCFDKAQQLDADWLVAAEIALTYLFYRNPSRGLLRARRACETSPDQYYAWLLQARCQRALGLDSQARRSLQTCLELCPGHEEARQMLAEVETASVPSVGRWLRGLFRR